MNAGATRNGRSPRDSTEVYAFWRAALACRRLDPAVQRPARCLDAPQTGWRPCRCRCAQRGWIRRSAASIALVLRWTTEADVAARSLPNGQRTDGDNRPALGPHPAGYGHHLLDFRADALHLL